MNGPALRSSRFGAQIYWDSGPETKYFDSLVESKAGWVRTEIYWNEIEPQDTTPDQFDWDQADRIMKAFNYLDVKVIATVGWAPYWAANPINGPLNELGFKGIPEFITALVERYDGDGIDDAPCSPRVDYWEFYNEPDRHYLWGDSPVDYARMLETVYPAVKAANPNAQVVFGGIANDWFQDQGGQFVRHWTETVLDAGGGPYFDIMNLHAYPNFWPEHASQPPGILEKVEKFRGILADYGYDKPIVVTETGANSWYNQVIDNEVQARYAVEIFTQTMAADTLAAIWFMLYDTPNSPGAYLNGLVTSDDPPQKKPVFYAYHTMVDMFEDAEFTRILSPEETGGEHILAYQFYDTANDRDLYVMWVNPVDTEEWRTMRFDASSVTQYSIYRDALTVTDEMDGAVDGRVTVGFDGAPIIVAIGR